MLQSLIASEALNWRVMRAREILAGRIRVLLAEREMNQTQLALKMDKSASWISGFMKGRRGIPLDLLDDIAKKLGVQVPDLFVDRDLLRQGQPLQEVHPLLKEAPRDPKARAAYLKDVLETLDVTLKELLRTQTEDTIREVAEAGRREARGRRRPRKGR